MTTRNHLLISGTGRAGTTFLIQLFTALGFDTGYQTETPKIYQYANVGMERDIREIGDARQSAFYFAYANAGMERDIREADAPYVTKDPELCESLDSILAGGDVVIDAAIIPMRDLFSAAESRRDVQRRTKEAKPHCKPNAPGGLTGTMRPEEQELVLQRRFYQIMYTLAKRNIPTTLLYFPRFIHEPEYLYSQLTSVLSGVSYDAFFHAFCQVARPELVHEFSPNEKAEKSAAVSENDAQPTHKRSFRFWKKG